MNKLTLEELTVISRQVAYHAPVVLAQRDPSDRKMDENSALLHRLWLRLCAKMNVRAGSFPTVKEETSHQRVFLTKLKDFFNTHLEAPISDQEYDRFIKGFLDEAAKQIRIQGPV